MLFYQIKIYHLLKLCVQFQDYLETAQLLVNHDPSSFVENQVRPSMLRLKTTSRFSQKENILNIFSH